MNKTSITTIILFALIIFQSCSSDDNDNSTDVDSNYFMSVQFDTVDLYQARPDIDANFGLENCLNNSDYEDLGDLELAFFTPSQYSLAQGNLQSGIVSQIETSDFTIDLYIVYYENEESHLSWPMELYNATFDSEFDENPTFYQDVDGNALLFENDGSAFTNCSNPFFFYIDFTRGNETLNLQSNWFIGNTAGSQPHVFNISTPILIRDSNTSVEYSVSGEFTADFKDSNDNIITLNCEFKTPMYMLK
ncbi:hypothetical protein [Bizionia sp. M204]|uniref:hypothetical protein n=1 Tax=Bizionia sp. M204 TaxID=2675331 RepID=UPI0020453F08|nr:hypothetical protein [Bizionia sp. M204]UPS90287.1 hypothetical protein GMA17_00495 [Bizionia sp. M204]